MAGAMTTRGGMTGAIMTGKWRGGMAGGMTTRGAMTLMAHDRRHHDWEMEGWRHDEPWRHRPVAP